LRELKVSRIQKTVEQCHSKEKTRVQNGNEQEQTDRKKPLEDEAFDAFSDYTQ